MHPLWTGIQGSARLRSKQNLLLHNHRLPSHMLQRLQTLHPRREHPRSARLLWLLLQTWTPVTNNQRKLLKQFPLLPRSLSHPSQNPNPQLHPPRLPHLLLPEPPQTNSTSKSSYPNSNACKNSYAHSTPCSHTHPCSNPLTAKNFHSTSCSRTTSFTSS